MKPCCHRLLALACVLVASLTWGAAASAKGRKMETIEQFQQAMGALDDAVYHQQQEGPFDGWAVDAMLLGRDLLLLSAPRHSDPAAQQDPMALVLVSHTTQRLHQLPWRRNATLVASDLEHGWVFAERAFVTDPGKEPRPQDGPRPAAQPAPRAAAVSATGRPSRRQQLGEPRSAGVAWVDLRQALSLPASVRRLALWVIYHDQLSNPAQTQIMGPPGADGPGIGLLEAKDLFRQLRQATDAGTGLPSFTPSPATPQLTAPGVSFTLARNSARLGDGAIALHGAMRLRVNQKMMIQTPAAAPAPGQPGPPVAVLRGMVLLVQAQEGRPHQLALDIPVWSTPRPREGDPADAVFNIDLATLLPKQAQPGTYQVYVVAGPYIAGPQALTLTDGR